ncbi:hypothetical protein B0T25DRAFT_623475 [Lasiosphaeria hispida]|uniref:Uncharacterized protein n=1 Tax=Lasiosphaeria hispida TaxID=260671 RepID=A0AAJ0MEK4_9PEZI|nr:hypothetical protein B0T25DRAFT_623475 [Lasiosphaeria hispida]
MTHSNSFTFDDFVVWPSSKPPDSLADYTTNTPTDRLSSRSPPSTDADVDGVSLASQSTARRDWGLPFTLNRISFLFPAFWGTFLQPKLEKLLDKKLPPNKVYKAEETNVVVSVTDRSERDLVKRFDELDIEWAILEKQLQTWSRLFLFSSTSKRMLSERAMQLDAEEVSGHPSIWREVYNLMRCPGPPCYLGPYCWRDSIGKRHYKLKTHHLRNLIKYLYAEEVQYMERQSKQGASQANFPPINITNVMPATPQASTLSSVPATPESTGLVLCDHSTCLEIPGLRDIAKACDLTLADGLDLEQVFKDQDAVFYIDNGVKRGIA